jgi:3-deoxy-D-manno-octulosonate 8-phosphate phosphatase (KDO 8-P phosphatase)
LLCLDVDGVLTDGRVLLSPDGVEQKTFSVIDGHGIVMLREAGVDVCLVTREASGIAAARARKLRIRCIEGVLQKGAVVRELRDELRVARSDAAFMGDDLPDLDAFEEVGLRISVPGARPEVRRAAHWSTRAPGGHGAVREVCDALLAARNRRPTRRG